MPSDIHVFVRFKERCVFAGEEVNCTITFKNVATGTLELVLPNRHQRRQSRRDSISQLAAQSSRNGLAIRSFHNARIINNADGNHDASNQVPTAASLHNSPSFDVNSPPQQHASVQKLQRPGHKQQRSVSIISVTSPVLPSSVGPAGRTPPFTNAHKRSSTTQIYSGPPRRPDQQYREPYQTHISPNISNGRPSPFSPSPKSFASQARGRGTPEFKFPSNHPTPVIDRRGSDNPSIGEVLSPDTALSPNSKRITSTNTNLASERSSGEFYSQSNHSEETMISEHPSIMSDRPQLQSPMMRPPDRPGPKSYHKAQAVNLLMGYAQLLATFTVDGSLVNQSTFEDIKQKGFLGGQGGGGVVGLKKSRPTSGFLSGFGFSSLGESLGNLVNNDNMSSVKEMNAVANSRAVPLLSTPQSLLFVDLHLEPGAEKSFSFTYILPQGLPASYRGKAIKINYNLTIGVQGLPGGRDAHTVRQVNIPLRVFPGVDTGGEIFGHDLMQPHVVLRDLARTKTVDLSDPLDQEIKPNKPTPTAEEGTSEFLQFVETLLDRKKRRQSSTGTTEILGGGAGGGSKQDFSETGRSIQAINRAILCSNQLSTGVDSSSSPNKFTIARNGLRVAVVNLDRVLHRLGESITAVVNFSDGQIKCATLRSTLETTEKVSPSLAVRSASAITRMTRKVHCSQSENVLFAKRAVFVGYISSSATPSFITSGVSLEWSLRLEFGTLKALEQEDGRVTQLNDVLEEVLKDERGTINVAVESVDCETFDVVIPITVYGDVVSDGKEDEDVVGIPL